MNARHVTSHLVNSSNVTSSHVITRHVTLCRVTGTDEYGQHCYFVVISAIGHFYTRGRSIRLDELGPTFVVRLVGRL